MKNKLPPLFKNSLGNQLKERLMYSLHHTSSYICMTNLQIPNISDHLPLLPFVQADDKYHSFHFPFLIKLVSPHYDFFILYYSISEYNI